jgi:TonB family protein
VPRSRNARLHRTIWPAFALTLSACGAAAQAPPHAAVDAPAAPTSALPFAQVAPPLPKLESVQQLDLVIEGLHRASWTLHSAPPQTRTDERGRTRAQDVDQWLLTPEHEAALKDLRAKAQREADKGDQAALAATLKEAAALAYRERYMAVVLGLYWTLEDRFALHAASLQALEDGESPQDRTARQNRLAQAVAKISGEIPVALAADSPDAQTEAVRQLNEAALKALKAYNVERGTLAAERSRQDRAQGKELVTLARATPCPEAVTQTSGSELPRLAELNAPLSSVYPIPSRRASFEGTVIVQVWLSATGCVEKAAVYQSSGVSELDDAAITWTLQAKFIPAERDHQPIAVTPKLPIRFSLH